MARETRDVHDFHAVSLRSIGTLLIEQGDSESLTIEADDDVLPRIITSVRAGRLDIRTTLLMHARQPIVYRLTARRLDAIELSGAANVGAERLRADRFQLVASGAGEVTIQDLTTDDLEVIGSGSSHIELAGAADRQRIRLSGADAYRAANLASREADIAVDGAGQVTVRVSERLRVDIRGAAAISYIGNPNIERRISGVGSLRKLAEARRASA